MTERNSTKVPSEDNSDGHDESIDHELQTDGSDGDVQEDNEESDTLCAVQYTDQYDSDASYTVRTVPNDINIQVVLVIRAKFGSFGLEMASEHAEELGRELLEAAQEGDA